MSKVINVKIDDKTGDGFINIDDFKEFLDVKKINSYQLTKNEDKTLIIQFFDKDNNQIKTIER